MIARLLTLALIALPTAAAAQVKYQPEGLFRNGFSERETAPGVWEVKGTSGERDGGVAVALYRAAELTRAAGADALRVTKQKVHVVRVTRRFSEQELSYHETATVTVRAVRDDIDRAACDMPERSRCMTLGVLPLMARFGPALGRAAPPGVAPAAVVSNRFPPELIAAVNARAAAALARRAAPVAAPFVPAVTLPPPSSLVAPVTERAASPATSAAPSAVESFGQTLRAARPVSGREPRQGWTVSD